MRTFVISTMAVIGLLIALESASDLNTLWAQPRIENQVFHFVYNYKAGLFVRRMSWTVRDPQGLWNALLPLQPPPVPTGHTVLSATMSFWEGSRDTGCGNWAR